MRKETLKLLSFLAIALAVALFVPQRASADDDDPPSRVARLAFAKGSVSFNPAGTDDWVSAVVNRPVTTGDKLWNDEGARSELSIGSAVIRLGSTTGFAFLNLTDNMTQVRITEGTLNIRVRHLNDDEAFEVDTPNLAFSVLRPGNYKINVNEAGDTTIVVVRDGEGEVTGGGSAYTIHPREIGSFSGTDELSADVQSWENGDDDFDGWCADRDRRIDHSVSARYVSTDAIGYEDLDEYGGWRPVPEYGTIWFPHTAIVGWAPYHYGHWAYIAPWGYTWVDDAPWGFAPFHYGRWVTVGGVWGWVPCAPRPVAVVGVAYVRPVYAPALVAWVGGPHFGIGIGIGGGGGAGVAWFPLGPREVYVPSYPVSRTYVNNVNVSNTTVNTTVVNNYYNTTVINKTTNVTNNNVTVNNQHYMNQSVPGAVSATTPQAFTSAQSVSKNSVAVNAREVASAPVAATSPSVAPAKQAVLGSGATATARPPAALATRAVVAKTPPPPAPVAFAKQQQAIQANGGKPIAMSQMRQIQPETAQAHPNIRIAPPSRPATPQNLQTNKPIAQPQTVNPNRPATPNNAVQSGQNNQPVQTNKPGNPSVNNVNQKTYNDRPAASRPNNANTANTVDPQLEQKHQQQLEQLHQKQDQEYQRVQQQQQQERQRAQQAADGAKQQQQQERQKAQQAAADEAKQQQQQERQKAQQAAAEAKQQQLDQKHQQQLDQLQQKHGQEQAKLQQRQQEEHQKAPPADKPSKPPKAEKEKPHK